MVYNYHLIYKTNKKQLNEDLHVFQQFSREIM